MEIIYISKCLYLIYFLCSKLYCYFQWRVVIFADLSVHLTWTADLEYDLRNIVDCGERWLVTFNATNTKLLSFIHHQESRLVPMKINEKELPESINFLLTFLVLYYDGLETIYSVHCKNFLTKGSLFTFWEIC